MIKWIFLLLWVPMQAQTFTSDRIVTYFDKGYESDNQTHIFELTKSTLAVNGYVDYLKEYRATDNKITVVLQEDSDYCGCGSKIEFQLEGGIIMEATEYPVIGAKKIVYRNTYLQKQ